MVENSEKSIKNWTNIYKKITKALQFQGLFLYLNPFLGSCLVWVFSVSFFFSFSLLSSFSERKGKGKSYVRSVQSQLLTCKSGFSAD